MMPWSTTEEQLAQLRKENREQRQQLQQLQQQQQQAQQRQVEAAHLQHHLAEWNRTKAVGDAIAKDQFETAERLEREDVAELRPP